MPEVIIRNPRTGEEYGIDSSKFRHGNHYQQPDGSRTTYADAGFRIVGLANGQPYTGPLNEPPSLPHRETSP